MKALTKNQRSALNCLPETGRFDLPPEEGGQIVQTSYGCSADYIYTRTVDRSDRSVTITAYQHPARRTEYDWQPWNHAPALGRRVGVIYDGPLCDEPSRA